MTPFLNRTEYSANNDTYSFKDGSGTVPGEMKHDMHISVSQRVEMPDGRLSGNGLFVLNTLFSWKERLGML